jgi:hypothetical protein
MRKLFFILLFLLPVISFSQVIRFMGRYDVSQVDYVDGTTWVLTGTFVDNTGSYTGLSATVNDKVIQRGYTSGGQIVFDRYKITGIVSQTTTDLVVNVKSDFTGGIQNNGNMPYTGSFPIATAVSDTSHLTYRTDFNINQIDPDYGAALDNLNLYETKAAINLATDTSLLVHKTGIISTTSPLMGGGDLSTNRTFYINTDSLAGLARRKDTANLLLSRTRATHDYQPLIPVGSANNFYGWDKTWRTPDINTLTGIDTTGVILGKGLGWNGSAWVPTGFAGGAFISVGQNNTGENVGSGAGVYYGKRDTILQFRRIAGQNGIIATENSNIVDIKLIQKDISYDSLANKPVPGVFQYEVVSDAQNNFTTTFPLLSTSVIWYNGSVIRSSQWSGIGTSTLTVSLDTKQYDFINLIK